MNSDAGLARRAPDPLFGLRRPPAQAASPVLGGPARILRIFNAVALLAVATVYLTAFKDEEPMTLPERMRLQEVEEVVARHGKRF